jgi:hypothetical protein
MLAALDQRPRAGTHVVFGGAYHSGFQKPEPKGS